MTSVAVPALPWPTLGAATCTSWPRATRPAARRSAKRAAPFTWGRKVSAPMRIRRGRSGPAPLREQPKVGRRGGLGRIGGRRRSGQRGVRPIYAAVGSQRQVHAPGPLYPADFGALGRSTGVALPALRKPGPAPRGPDTTKPARRETERASRGAGGRNGCPSRRASGAHALRGARRPVGAGRSGDLGCRGRQRRHHHGVVGGRGALRVAGRRRLGLGGVEVGGRLLELRAVEAVVRALGCDELVVRTLLDDVAVLHHEDEVGVARWSRGCARSRTRCAPRATPPWPAGAAARCACRPTTWLRRGSARGAGDERPRDRDELLLSCGDIGASSSSTVSYPSGRECTNWSTRVATAASTISSSVALRARSVCCRGWIRRTATGPAYHAGARAHVVATEFGDVLPSSRMRPPSSS